MEKPSILSRATANQSSEFSDSNSSSLEFAIKNPIEEGGANHPRFKGVVSQNNGHWGAQIYANHQRIWLGTFKSENEAAMAYDSAAIKLLNGDSQRNFPLTELTIRERTFQSQFSMEQVLSMIKDGSYATKFSDYLKVAQIHEGYDLANLNGGIRMRELFEKELTPSDVSKLNRLVIPKRYALEHFPPISEVEEEKGGRSSENIELMFFDRSMKSWKFRYCYWKSSQSFVFTRGWNSFAKEKGLKSKDRVIFLADEYSDGMIGMQKLCIIDVAYKDREMMDGRVLTSDEASLWLQLGQPGGRNNYEDELLSMSLKIPDLKPKVSEIENDGGDVEDNVGNLEVKGIKLFGVQIV